MSAALEEEATMPGLAPPPRKARVTIEALLQWAFSPGRDGGTTWKADPMLSLDQGLTARPRKKPRGSWIIASACAGMRYGRPAPLRLVATSDKDAALVASAVNALPGRIAERVRAHARAKSKPDWMDTEKRLVPVLNANGKGVIFYTNNRHKKMAFCKLRVTFDRSITEASKRRWIEWRDALETIQTRLGDTLERWEINGYLPKEEPWR